MKTYDDWKATIKDYSLGFETFLVRYYNLKDFCLDERKYTIKSLTDRYNWIVEYNDKLLTKDQVNTKLLRHRIDTFAAFEERLKRDEVVSLFDADYGKMDEDCFWHIGSLKRAVSRGDVFKKIDDAYRLINKAPYIRYQYHHDDLYFFSMWFSMQDLIHELWYLYLHVDAEQALPYIHRLVAVIDFFSQETKNSHYYQEIELAEVFAKKASEETILKMLDTTCMSNYFHGKKHPAYRLASVLCYTQQFELEKVCLDVIADKYPTLIDDVLYERKLLLDSMNQEGIEVYRKQLQFAKDLKMRTEFRVDSLNWNDKEYKDHFLICESTGVNFTQSIAIRSVNEVIQLSAASIPSIDEIAQRLNILLQDEYGDVVEAIHSDATILMNGGKEVLDGVLVGCKECLQLGLYFQLLKLGKKLNLHMYILYHPYEEKLEIQKQQVLSMVQQLSPVVQTWETSLKTSILMGLQSILNQNGSSKPKESHEIVF